MKSLGFVLCTQAMREYEREFEEALQEAATARDNDVEASRLAAAKAVGEAAGLGRR